MKKALRLFLYKEVFAICRLEPSREIPAWAIKGNPSFFTVSKTETELSITCVEKNVPPGITREGGWRAFSLEGPIAFSQTGILISLIEPLANAGISIFAISTFDTDFIMLKEMVLEKAIQVLQERFTIVEQEGT